MASPAGAKSDKALFIAAEAPARPGKGSYRELFLLALPTHALVAGLVCLYYLGYLVLVMPVEGARTSGIGQMAFGFLSFTLPMLAFSQVPLRLYHLMRNVRPQHPIPALAKDLWEFFTDARRVALGLPMILMIFTFMRTFGDMKANLPVLNPFSWDVTFQELDRLVHFGIHPWQWLQPILGYPLITFVISFNYNLWFFIVLMICMSFAFATRTSVCRTRFFVAFLLVWAVGGSGLAVLLSSAGPCFYGRLGLAPDPYAELMVYLNEVNTVFPIWALQVQDALWASYMGAPGIDGISAMPSMHNGLALLFVLAVPREHRLARALLVVHCVLIFIGSVHLAWHYAIDAYLAWAVTIVAWAVARPIAEWWEARPASLALANALAAR